MICKNCSRLFDELVSQCCAFLQKKFERDGRTDGWTDGWLAGWREEGGDRWLDNRAEGKIINDEDLQIIMRFIIRE